MYIAPLEISAEEMGFVFANNMKKKDHIFDQYQVQLTTNSATLPVTQLIVFGGSS